MSRTMLIDATDPEETRVVVLNQSRLEEYDHENAHRKQLKGNIYLAKVTRVEPSLQAAFVDYGGNRHGFLPFSEIHPDYYKIPVADREALKAEEAVGDDDSADEETAGGSTTTADNEAAADNKVTAESEAAAEGEATAEGEAAEGDESGSDSDESEADGDESDATAEEAAKANGAQGANGSAEPKSEPEEVEVESQVETVGGDEADDEARRRAIMARRYKIQEVIKRRQVLLVQVTKEERGNKGAALTTYLSLAGRYCVLMPNTNKGGGISRKIANVADRRRLKKITSELSVPEGMAVIVRTAGSQRSKVEIRRDYEYLLRLWDQIREATLQSNAPSLIHEEANLIMRSVRDLYTRDMNEILVGGEEGYKTAKAFMKSLMPSHARKVQLFKDSDQPLFRQYKVERQLDEMHSSSVQLASGGYIVLNSTEALVAIDVNSGRATKERHIEETALKTNLEAASEIARQLRLRDLAGLIVVDFIDMMEQRHNRDVERRLKEAMRQDRARIQLGRISPFGLLEMSRQRLRPSLFESSTVTCPHCQGRGYIRNTDSAALHVLRALEEEGLGRRGGKVVVTVPTSVGFYILNQKRDRLLEIEQRYGFSVEIAAEDSLVPPAFELSHTGGESRRPERASAETERSAEASDEDGRKRRRRRRSRHRDEEAEGMTASPRGNGAAAPQESEAEAAEADAEETEAREATGDGEQDDGKGRSRRRRGRRGGRRRSRRRDEGQIEGEASTEAASEAAEDTESPVASDAVAETSVDTPSGEEAAPDDSEAAPAKPRRPRRSRSRSGSTRGSRAATKTDESADDASAEAKPARRRRPARRKAASPAAEGDAGNAEGAAPPSEAPAEPAQPVAESASAPPPTPNPELHAGPANGGSRSDAPAESQSEQPPVDIAEDSDRPKRRGWWSKLLQ